MVSTVSLALEELIYLCTTFRMSIFVVINLLFYDSSTRSLFSSQPNDSAVVFRFKFSLNV